MREEINKGGATTYLFLPLLSKLQNDLFLGMSQNCCFALLISFSLFLFFFTDNAIASIDDRVLINLRKLKQLLFIDGRNNNGKSLLFEK